MAPTATLPPAVQRALGCTSFAVLLFLVAALLAHSLSARNIGAAISSLIGLSSIRSPWSGGRAPCSNVSDDSDSQYVFSPRFDKGGIIAAQHCEGPGSTHRFPCRYGRTGVLNNVCVGGGSGVINVYNDDEEYTEVVTLSDNGGGHRFTVKHSMRPAPLPLLNRPLVLHWWTCPGNAHHFLVETFGPLADTLTQIGLVPATPGGPLADYYIDKCSPTFAWRDHFESKHDAACNGPRFRPFMCLLPIRQSYDRNCLTWPGDVPRPPDSEWPPLRCYKHAVFVRPARAVQATISLSAAAFLASKIDCHVLDNGTATAALWSTFGDSPRLVVRVLFLQRRERSVINMDELVARTVAQPNVVARVVDFDEIDIWTQAAWASCYADVMVGVHGAGMQWGSLTGLNRPAELGAARSAVLELSHPRWSGFYAGRLRSKNRHTASMLDEMMVPNNASFRVYAPNGTSMEGPWPRAIQDKWSDIRVVHLDEFSRKLEGLVSFVRGGDAVFGELDSRAKDPTGE